MKIAAVTTFSSKGLIEYGRRMIETFDKHWSCGVVLTVYAEGWTPQQHGIPPYINVRYHDLAASDWLASFKIRHKGKPTTDFRRAVVRFSHKIAALIHFCETTDADFVIWLDGDIVTHTDFDIEHLETLLPHDSWITWLNRTAMYPECGFYIINTRHPRHADMMRELRRLYEDDGFLQEKEWHDSYLLQQAVLRNNIEPRSLSGVAARTHHPLINGPLGKWFDHLKGARKAQGRSPKSDLHFKRDEGYWK